MATESRTRAESPSRKAQATERKEEILAIAADVLIRDGYAQFNLRKVAAAAGVRLAAVQYYFPTREGLLLGTLDRVFSSWNDSYAEILERHEVPAEKRLLQLQKLARRHQTSTSATRFQLELFALAQHEPAIGLYVDKTYLIYRKSLAKVLREIRPDLPKGRLLEFATLLAAQWEGLAFFSKDFGHRHSESFEDALEHALNGFVASFRQFKNTEGK